MAMRRADACTSRAASTHGSIRRAHAPRIGQRATPTQGIEPDGWVDVVDALVLSNPTSVGRAEAPKVGRVVGAVHDPETLAVMREPHECFIAHDFLLIETAGHHSVPLAAGKGVSSLPRARARSRGLD